MAFNTEHLGSGLDIDGSPTEIPARGSGRQPGRTVRVGSRLTGGQCLRSTGGQGPRQRDPLRRRDRARSGGHHHRGSPELDCAHGCVPSRRARRAHRRRSAGLNTARGMLTKPGQRAVSSHARCVEQWKRLASPNACSTVAGAVGLAVDRPRVTELHNRQAVRTECRSAVQLGNAWPASGGLAHANRRPFAQPPAPQCSGPARRSLTQPAACSHSRPTRCVEPRALCRATRAPPDRGSDWCPYPDALSADIDAVVVDHLPGLPAFEHRGGSGAAHTPMTRVVGDGINILRATSEYRVNATACQLDPLHAHQHWDPRSRRPATEWRGRSRTARGTAAGPAARPPARTAPAAPDG